VSLTSLLHVIAIDLALSGDNTVVIGLVARRLPPRQRRLAIATGTAGAVALRFALTLVAARLLRVPYLHLLGGLLLLGVAARSLREDGGAPAGGAAPVGLAAALGTIVVADAAMSLDNVLGVAAAAGDDAALLVTGLAFSVGLMVLAGNAVAAALGRVTWLAYAGAAVVAWTGAVLVLRDPAVPALVGAAGWAAAAFPAAAAVGVPLLARRVARRG
jgi:YjbE family integral membrane protein